MEDICTAPSMCWQCNTIIGRLVLTSLTETPALTKRTTKTTSDAAKIFRFN